MPNQIFPTQFSLKEISRFLILVVGLSLAGGAMITLPYSYDNWKTYLYMAVGALPLLRPDLAYRLRYLTIIFLWTSVVGIIGLIANYKFCWQRSPICHNLSSYGYALVASYFVFWLIAGLILNRKTKIWP